MLLSAHFLEQKLYIKNRIKCTPHPSPPAVGHHALLTCPRHKAVVVVIVVVLVVGIGGGSVDHGGGGNGDGISRQKNKCA